MNKLKINGWTNAELTRCATNLVSLHAEKNKNPVTREQARRALLAIDYRDVAKTCWQDIVRDMQKMA